MEQTLNAAELTREEDPINIPQPEVVETPTEFVNRAVSPIIQAATPEAEQRDEVFQQIQEVGDNRTTFDQQFNRQLRGFGTPDAVRQLRDTQQELARLNTQFDVQNVQIAEGNSIGQGQREVTQNDREQAVRTAGLAAQAQLLQGNIQTAQSIARDVVNFAFQDEQARLNQLGKQYDALDGRVEGQEEQLRQQRIEENEAEKQALEDTKANVEAAMLSGGTTPEEQTRLTDPNLTREEKNQLALQIIGRTANEERELSLEQERERLAKLRLDNQATGNPGVDALIDSGVLGSNEDPIPSLLASTAGGRALTQSETEPLTNANRVADGLQDLVDTISGANTDPILGIFKRVNPYNLEAASIDAAITQLVPQLARGTYGEVGVLTDSDVARYSQTLPNLTNTEDQNKAVLALTLRKVRSGFVSQLESMAAAGRDVSGFINIYNDFNQKIEQLESELGVGTDRNADFEAEFDQVFDNNQTTAQTTNDDGLWKKVGNFLFGQ